MLADDTGVMILKGCFWRKERPRKIRCSSLAYVDLNASGIEEERETVTYWNR